jgi:hypothetical protein
MTTFNCDSQITFAGTDMPRYVSATPNRLRKLLSAWRAHRRTTCAVQARSDPVAVSEHIRRVRDKIELEMPHWL